MTNGVLLIEHVATCRNMYLFERERERERERETLKKVSLKNVEGNII